MRSLSTRQSLNLALAAFHQEEQRYGLKLLTEAYQSHDFNHLVEIVMIYWDVIGVRQRGAIMLASLLGGDLCYTNIWKAQFALAQIVFHMEECPEKESYATLLGEVESRLHSCKGSCKICLCTGTSTN